VIFAFDGEADLGEALAEVAGIFLQAVSQFGGFGKPGEDGEGCSCDDGGEGVGEEVGAGALEG